MEEKHPVPAEYHELFYIGQLDRRGNIIDFKIPPIILDSLLPMNEFQYLIFNEHIPADQLPIVYNEVKHFIILRPTALPHRIFIREKLIKFGLCISEEFELTNFMKLADTLYLLEKDKPFHWEWRAIMRILHDKGVQDQNRAVVFILKDHENNKNVMDIKKRIRADIGETPVLVRYNDNPEIALGIHHLHSPDLDRMHLEYNALMHAKNKTSIFS